MMEMWSDNVKLQNLTLKELYLFVRTAASFYAKVLTNCVATHGSIRGGYSLRRVEPKLAF